MSDARDRKLENLGASLCSLGSVAVAFSGGVDSTFLAAVAQEVLGERMLAVTAETPFLSRQEVADVHALARRLGFRHQVIRINPLADEQIRANPENRCYRCKRAIFKRIGEVAAGQGIEVVADGSNADDRHEHRPGLRALRELGVRSPLAEAELTKSEIRDASRVRGLPTADQSSNACLATRIPFGTEIRPDTLAAIDHAEAALHALGFRQVRVRVHDRLARLELGPDDLARVTAPELRDRAVEAVRAAGFSFVTLDLGGYRTGGADG